MSLALGRNHSFKPKKKTRPARRRGRHSEQRKRPTARQWHLSEPSVVTMPITRSSAPFRQGSGLSWHINHVVTSCASDQRSNGNT
eukprot:4885578-Pyramimonas_sp.AAC.1